MSLTESNLPETATTRPSKTASMIESLIRQQQSLNNRFTITPFNQSLIFSMSQEISDGTIDVTHLAGLARLALDEAAQAQVGDDLKSIMAVIDAMQAINTDGVKPLSHPLDASARLRADVVSESPDPEHFQQTAPSTGDHYYLVPRVVE